MKPDTAPCVILNSQHTIILNEFVERCTKVPSARVVFQPHSPNRLLGIGALLVEWGSGLPIFFVEGQYGDAVTAEGQLVNFRYREELTRPERSQFRMWLASGDTPFERNLIVATHILRLPKPLPLSRFTKLNGVPPQPHKWPYTIAWPPRGYRRELLPPEALADEVSSLEGEERRRMIRHRYREARLRQAKIDAVLSATGSLRCEVVSCGFDFRATYGVLGATYAHVHHLLPLAAHVPTRRGIGDLAIVCANCHAMIHRNGVCRGLAEVERAMKRAKSRAPAA